MNNKILLSLVLVGSLFFTTGTFAQEGGDVSVETLQQVQLPEPTFDIDAELQFWLDQGSAAPYKGVLLNPEAVALILSEHEAQQKRAEAALEKQLSDDQAVLDLAVGKLEVRIDSEAEKSKITDTANKEENDRLLKINEDLRNDRSSFWSHLPYVGVGAAIMAVAGLVIVVSGS